MMESLPLHNPDHPAGLSSSSRLPCNLSAMSTMIPVQTSHYGKHQVNHLYGIDHRCINTGKCIAATKWCICFSFGFSNANAIAKGWPGPQCCGNKHEAWLLGNISSLLMDKKSTIPRTNRWKPSLSFHGPLLVTTSLRSLLMPLMHLVTQPFVNLICLSIGAPFLYALHLLIRKERIVKRIHHEKDQVSHPHFSIYRYFQFGKQITKHQKIPIWFSSG